MDREAMTAVILAAEEHFRRMLAEQQKYAGLHQPSVVREYVKIVKPLRESIKTVKAETGITAGWV